MGRYWCTKPFMFSLEPRYEGLSRSQKYTAIHVRLLSSLCIVISRPWSNVMLKRMGCAMPSNLFVKVANTLAVLTG